MPATKRQLKVSELRVGLFVLGAMIVTAVLILNSNGIVNPFKKNVRLKARFESADGLRPGADVQLAGLSIGKVEDVTFLPPDAPQGQRIEATMAVQDTLDNKPITELIRTDSTAQLVSTSLLGNDRMINIIPGTTKGSPVAENSILVSSSAVGLNQLTETGNDLLKTIDKLAIPANEILNKANQGQGTLGRMINDESLYNNLDKAVADTHDTMVRLQTTIDRINKGQGSAGKLLNDPELYNNLNRSVAQLEAITTDIRSGRGTAGKFITDEAVYNETKAAIAQLRETAQKLSSVADDVKLITADLRDGKGSAGRLLKDETLYDNTRDALAKFGSTTTRLDSLLADVQAGRGTVGKLMTDESLYNSVNQTANNVSIFTAEGNKLLEDFRKDPKKYLTIKLKIF